MTIRFARSFTAPSTFGGVVTGFQRPNPIFGIDGDPISVVENPGGIACSPGGTWTPGDIPCTFTLSAPPIPISAAGISVGDEEEVSKS